MFITVDILYLKNKKTVPAPAGFPSQVTVELADARQLTDKVVEEAVCRRLAYHNITARQGVGAVEFGYIPVDR
ncbi:MAG: hypothetical protein A3J09_01485 [Candidatus Zambryskibacteria bacterium RIFCSPLOWO2_02_FULL_51_21]|uniref:Uncharacterized protein n=1 Tax=Candidatus Zambryskibacteria bacterium RIFCSPHIGHO2_02_FULL_43_37 TaxID=1802749 RepID=A0A1G2TGV4_9BACT|nr:MAG: hypothetical protein A2723_01485 [Candidatus Zambryskibacteria bacterium RIFCSPHIGHO2_01_FULL_52_18]OHA96517.1 MAG: hypothetical protein A3D49_01415 [Candidatus Zambryskibacteria bacterium RIFCSPHIGHO2_02_FULL_43_37]OHB07186.1 MAG: hypothetical protein A2944_01180 [Candidatus Zambryskibacteria bacterium RIFCSPLOWO2_01_FULL_52_12]OHB11219.1 MAG: hypothetical protein A3J09_01485 [Candidatus Zambryskibacteria bacterium RIFCSPLOWO2_02_FULL_51_21]